MFSSGCVPLQPIHQSDTALNASHMHFHQVDSLLNYTPDIVVNWPEVVAVRRLQIWHHECMAVGFY